MDRDLIIALLAGEEKLTMERPGREDHGPGRSKTKARKMSRIEEDIEGRRIEQ